MLCSRRVALAVKGVARLTASKKRALSFVPAMRINIYQWAKTDATLLKVDGGLLRVSDEKGQLWLQGHG